MSKFKKGLEVDWVTEPSDHSPAGDDFSALARYRYSPLAKKRSKDAEVLMEAVDKLQEKLKDGLSTGGRDYYGGDTVLTFIEKMGLGFSLGNAVKYIARAGKKDPDKRREDLLKARDYINREIEREY